MNLRKTMRKRKEENAKKTKLGMFLIVPYWKNKQEHAK
jgi:hypothetical protein